MARRGAAHGGSISLGHVTASAVLSNFLPVCVSGCLAGWPAGWRGAQAMVASLKAKTIISLLILGLAQLKAGECRVEVSGS